MPELQHRSRARSGFPRPRRATGSSPAEALDASGGVEAILAQPEDLYLPSGGAVRFPPRVAGVEEGRKIGAGAGPRLAR